MASSTQASPKRGWDQFNDNGDGSVQVGVPNAISLSLLRPDSLLFTSPDKRNKNNNIYEFDGISVLNSPSPLGGSRYNQPSPRVDDDNDTISSPKSDYTRLFTQAMLSPGMEDAAPMSPMYHGRSAYHDNNQEVITLQVPTSRDWSFQSQSPPGSNEFNGFSQSQGGNYMDSAYNQYMMHDNRPMPGSLNLGDQMYNNNYHEYEANPHQKHNLKVLQDRMMNSKASGGIALDGAGISYPMYGEIRTDPITGLPMPMSALQSDPSSIMSSEDKLKLRRKSSDESSADEQSRKDKITRHISGLPTGQSNLKIPLPKPGVVKMDSQDASDRKPPLPGNMMNSSGNYAGESIAEVANLSMAASTLASIASPPQKTNSVSRSSSGNVNNPTSSASTLYMHKGITCNCKKSRCLKLYCDCFRLEKFCDGCNCTDCANLAIFEADRKQAINQILDRNPSAFSSRISSAAAVHIAGCRCKKSSCLKKYCECFTGSVPCTDKCRCVECRNTVDQYHTYAFNGSSSFVGSRGTDSDGSRYRSNSTGSLWGTNNTIPVPGSASTTSSMSSLPGMAGLSIRNMMKGTPDGKGETRRKRGSKSGSRKGSDDEDDENDAEEDDDEVYIGSSSRQSRYSSRRSSRGETPGGVLADIITASRQTSESDSTPLELDIETIIDSNTGNGRRSSSRQKKAPPGSPVISRSKSQDVYASPSSKNNNSVYRSLSNYLGERQLSPPNSDEAKATVSKLLALGQHADEEKRIREAREASESLLLLSPKRTRSSSGLVEITEIRGLDFESTSNSATMTEGSTRNSQSD